MERHLQMAWGRDLRGESGGREAGRRLGAAVSSGRGGGCKGQGGPGAPGGLVGQSSPIKMHRDQIPEGVATLSSDGHGALEGTCIQGRPSPMASLHPHALRAALGGEQGSA